MYIEQLKKNKINEIAYIIGLSCLLGFFGLNIISTFFVETNVNETIQSLIDTLGKTTTFFMLVAPLSFLCVLLLLWIKYINGQSLVSLTTARPKIDWQRFGFMFCLWGGFLVISTLFTYFFFPKDIILQFNWNQFLPFALVAVILIPLQIAFEEYFFRGYLLQYLGYKTNSRFIPFFVSSILFGLMHIGNPEISELGYWFLAFYIGTGFVLGIFTLMDDGLEFALGFHAANNLISALLITSDISVFQTDSIFKDVSDIHNLWPLAAQLFVIYPIMLFICAKKYNWNNWKQNLFGKLAS